ARRQGGRAPVPPRRQEEEHMGADQPRQLLRGRTGGAGRSRGGGPAVRRGGAAGSSPGAAVPRPPIPRRPRRQEGPARGGALARTGRQGRARAGEEGPRRPEEVGLTRYTGPVIAAAAHETRGRSRGSGAARPPDEYLALSGHGSVSHVSLIRPLRGIDG